jgi:hypothetical protein
MVTPQQSGRRLAHAQIAHQQRQHQRIEHGIESVERPVHSRRKQRLPLPRCGLPNQLDGANRHAGGIVRRGEELSIFQFNGACSSMFPVLVRHHRFTVFLLR